MSENTVIYIDKKHRKKLKKLQREVRRCRFIFEQASERYSDAQEAIARYCKDEIGIETLGKTY